MANTEEKLEMNPNQNDKIKKSLMKDGVFEKASYTPYIGDGYENAEKKFLFIGDCKLPVKKEFIKEDKKDIFPTTNYCTQIVHYCKLIKDMDDVEDIKTLKDHLIPPENKRLSMESIRTLKKYVKNKAINYEDFAYYNFFYNQFDNVVIPNQGLSSKSDKLKKYQDKFLTVIKKINPDRVVIENSVLKNKIIGRSRDSSFFERNDISYEIAGENDVPAIDDCDDNITRINDELNYEFFSVIEEKYEDIYSFFMILNKIPVEKIDQLKYEKKMELLRLTQLLHKASTTKVNSLSYETMVGPLYCLCEFFFKKISGKINVEENKTGTQNLLKKIIGEYHDVYMMKNFSTRRINKYLKRNYFKNLSKSEFTAELQKLVEEFELLVDELEKKSFKCEGFVTNLKAIINIHKKIGKSATVSFIQFILKAFAEKYVLNSKEIDPIVFLCIYEITRFLYVVDVRKRSKCSKNKHEKDLREFIKKLEDKEFRERIQLLIKKYPEIVGLDKGTISLEKKYFENLDGFSEKKTNNRLDGIMQEYNSDYLAQISNDETTDLIKFDQMIVLKYIDELNDQELKTISQVLIKILFKKIGELNYYEICQLLDAMKKRSPDIASNESEFKIKKYRDYNGKMQEIVDTSCFTKKMKVSVNAYSLFMYMKRMRAIQYYAEKKGDNENIEHMLKILQRDNYYIGVHLIPSALEYIKDQFKDTIPYIEEKNLTCADINEYLREEGKKPASGIDNKLMAAYKYYATNPERRKRKMAQIMTKRIFENKQNSITMLIREDVYKDFKEKDKIITNWTPRNKTNT